MSRFPTRWALWCLAPAAGLLAAVAAAARTAGVPSSHFTRDPVVVLGGGGDAGPLVGLVSHVGVLLWAAAAAIALFTALLLRARSVDPAEPRFFFWAGMLSLWLLLDDLFLFHEWLFPVVLGVRTRVLFAAYGLATALLLWRFAPVLRRSAYPLLGLALAGFAGSVAVDLLPEAWFARHDWLYFAEDGAKLLAIAAWLAFFTHAAADRLATRTSDLAAAVR